MDFEFEECLGNTTSQILMSFPKDEEFSNLTRYQKGFWYERFSQILLEANNVSFSGNSILFEDWKQKQIEGYDFRERFPNGESIRVECKLLLKPIYPSWFYKDWLGRSADIYVTNNVYAIPYRCRRLLSERGKKLLSTTEFIMYVQKRMRGNKYAYLNIFSNTSRYDTSDREQIIFLDTSYPATKTMRRYCDFVANVSGDYRSLNAESWKNIRISKLRKHRHIYCEVVWNQ